MKIVDRCQCRVEGIRLVHQRRHSNSRHWFTVSRRFSMVCFTSMKRLLSRRGLIGSGAAFTMASSLKGAKAPARDFLKELGVRPIINGAGVYTFSTASLMRPEVVEAIKSISTKFVRLDELHDAVGQRIAKMLGTEAAMVPSGAAAGLTLGTAAVLTGEDPDKIRRIPDLTSMKTEVVVQKSHRFPYDHMVRNCGVKLV